MPRLFHMVSWKQSLSNLKKELGQYSLKSDKKKEVFKAMGLEQRLSIEKAFKNERSPEGKHWQKNEPFYKKWKDKRFGSKKILDLTGKLQKSFYTKIHQDSLKVGTDLSVASDHQFGIGKLPQRRFLGKDKDYEKNMNKRIQKIFKRLK